MTNNKITADIEKTKSDLFAAQTEIEKINHKLLGLNEQRKHLTKHSRNNYIFHLGLLAEKNIKVSHYLTDDDLEYIFRKAFSNPEILSLIDHKAKSNIQASIKAKERG